MSDGFAGRFEARIGISGSKHVYLGLFATEVEAARAYDRAVVRLKGLHASTNLHLSDYGRQVSEHELKRLQVCRLMLQSACAIAQHFFFYHINVLTRTSQQQVSTSSAYTAAV